MKLALGLLPLWAAAANYSAVKTTTDGVEVVRLRDERRRTEVAIAPALGNTAFEMKVTGKNVLWFPFTNLAEWKKVLTTSAIPLLAPWANRLDEEAFWANGRRYRLSPEIGNLRRDGANLPIHGVLYFSDAWQVVSVKANAGSARVVSRLEFWRRPEMMAQFPFAHTLTMTHTLAGGVLEVKLRIENHANAPLPVAVGFHPFFRLHDAPRPEWRVHIAARTQYVLDKRMIPTGETRPASYGDPHLLGAAPLDDELTGLVRGADGRASFWVEGKRERLTVEFGPKYPVATVFTPPEKEAICIEPMAAITNAFNLAHRGIYKDLQSIPPGGEWTESFWVKPEGFR